MENIQSRSSLVESRDSLIAQIDSCNERITSIKSDLLETAQQIEQLTKQRDEYMLELKSEKSELESLESQLKVVNDSLSALSSGAEIREFMLATAIDIIKDMSAEELAKLVGAYQMYAPISNELPMDEQDDYGITSNSYIEPTDEIDGVAPVPSYEAPKQSEPVAPVQPAPVVPKKSTDIKPKKVSVPSPDYKLQLSQFTTVADFIKNTDIGHCKAHLYFGDTCYTIPSSELIPVVKATNEPTKKGIERLRMLYIQAFIRWMYHTGKDMSADSVMDYLLGYKYIESDGVLSGIGGSHSALCYYCKESPSGVVVKEVSHKYPIDEMYEVYRDKDGYTVYASFSPNTATYKKLFVTMFGTYCSTRNPNVKLPKCVGIEFSEIFSDVYVAFEEA